MDWVCAQIHDIPQATAATRVGSHSGARPKPASTACLAGVDADSTADAQCPAPTEARTLRAQSKLPPTRVEALLVWPRGGNTGDRLIVDACERYIGARGISVWRSDGSIEEAALEGDTTYLGDLFASFRGMIMFPGGGNIGIYPDNGMIRAAVLQHLGPQHRCLVFPQSALQPEPALVDPRVTVWCRDATSHAILRDAGTKTALVPDVALFMDDVIPKRPDGERLFFIKRPLGGDTESIDNGIDLGGPCADLTRNLPLGQVIATLEPYATVVSNRLHGALIALMMRKKTVVLPVGYHKSKSFYETWLADEPGAAFAENNQDLLQALASLRTPQTDFAKLFCQHADRAFNRFLLEA